MKLLEEDELRDEEIEIDEADLFLRKKYEIEAEEMRFYKENAPFYNLYQWADPGANSFKIPLLDTKLRAD